MTEEEEKSVIVRMLKNYIMDKDSTLTVSELINKYRSELEDLCTLDKDTFNLFGRVNTWWVFGEVAEQINYDVFMAEVNNVGYKRTKRGEKEMPNELFELEYAPLILDINAVEKDYTQQITIVDELIKIESEKKGKEKNSDKVIKIDNKIKDLNKQKKVIEDELSDVKNFISLYYDDNQLKDEYKERNDSILINEFRFGKLKKYCSEAIALHESTYNTILDYMRTIKWE